MCKFSLLLKLLCEMQGPNSNISIPNDKTVHWDNGLCIYKNVYIQDIWNCCFLNSNLLHVLYMVACIKQLKENCAWMQNTKYYLTRKTNMTFAFQFEYWYNSSEVLFVSQSFNKTIWLQKGNMQSDCISKLNNQWTSKKQPHTQAITYTSAF